MSRVLQRVYRDNNAKDIRGCGVQAGNPIVDDRANNNNGRFPFTLADAGNHVIRHIPYNEDRKVLAAPLPFRYPERRYNIADRKVCVVNSNCVPAYERENNMHPHYIYSKNIKDTHVPYKGYDHTDIAQQDVTQPVETMDVDTILENFKVKKSKDALLGTMFTKNSTSQYGSKAPLLSVHTKRHRNNVGDLNIKFPGFVEDFSAIEKRWHVLPPEAEENFFIGKELYSKPNNVGKKEEFADAKVVVEESWFDKAGKIPKSIKEHLKEVTAKQTYENIHAATSLELQYGFSTLGPRDVYPSIFHVPSVYDGTDCTCYTKAAALFSAMVADNVDKAVLPHWMELLKTPFANPTVTMGTLLDRLKMNDKADGGYSRFGRLFSRRAAGEYENVEIIPEWNMSYHSCVITKDTTAAKLGDKLQHSLDKLAASKQDLIVAEVLSLNNKEIPGMLEQQLRAINDTKGYRPLTCTITSNYSESWRHTETIFFDKASNAWWGNIDSEMQCLGFTLSSAIDRLKELDLGSGDNPDASRWCISGVLMEKDTPLHRMQKKNDFYTTQTLTLPKKGNFIVCKQKDNTILMQEVKRHNGKEYIAKVVHLSVHNDMGKKVLRENCVFEYDVHGKLTNMTERKSNELCVKHLFTQSGKEGEKITGSKYHPVFDERSLAQIVRAL